MDTRSLAQRMVDAANAINASRKAEERRNAGLQTPEPLCLPLPNYWVTDPASAHLPAIQHWSHPFGDRGNPLRQLTLLANAERGYYPLGRNGFWHLGVHFDAGTAGILDQSQVRCVADGEVVAYRIDTRSPSTRYLFDDAQVERPFSRNFVLVRHRLQAPEISGLSAPPSLTLYSLYMHLEDWAAYRQDQTLKRPAFWPESNTRRVKDTEKDFVPGLEGLHWLRCRIGPNGGAVISGLARGTEVTLSGTGSYRKLENIPGPRQLLQDGALLGYVDSSFLEPLPRGDYRIATWRDDGTLNVRPSASVEGKPLMTLPNGTEVAVSGTGNYRKLEWVNQYVHFDSLLGEREPQALNEICVLELPVPIRAGELIGHLGAYQDHGDALPRRQLHLEMFSSESVQTFLDVSRAWAQHLPASARTWLKLPQGTPVVPHQTHFSATTPPRANTGTPTSSADLHLPKQLLEGLGADSKIRIPARDGHAGFTWYRLDDLLHGSEGQLLAGWVQVEDDHAHWHSPWDWSGYAAILNGDSLESCQAYALNVQGILPSERDRARAARLADLSDQGPIRSRLFDLVDRERHEVMTAEELQQALHLPALAQSISRLAIYSESEWHWRPGKWDALDDLFGHSSSSPHHNWLAEKERIQQLCWWNEVAPRLGLPVNGHVWHLHPVGLMGHFNAGNDENDLRWLKVPFGQLTFDTEGNDVEDESNPLHRYFSRVVHWPGGVSGVTIGRGYDLGQQMSSELDLDQAGVIEPLKTWLVDSQGLTSLAAKNRLETASREILLIQITRKQQYNLFITTYKRLEDDVKRICQKAATIRAYHANPNIDPEKAWSDIPDRIKEILIDLRYRGDYTPTARSHIQSAAYLGDAIAFGRALSERAHWPNVPQERFQRRINYYESRN
ncbi:lysozyme family protein [Metapseudomonas furukawaii]|uniref:EF hand domain protein n=1 Tax=Metapseudomonas furukawaii TaxID=1149133 RepID=A0AAD1C448_METFU|nr:hypothetical protein [Pseudomonas furukawaii]ELS29653.1 hypothetical protein ppKF707_5195 [Pseudomonas furukawaii]BAU77131.1 EF hand domain protein [Pseudomonas furukawaii]